MKGNIKATDFLDSLRARGESAFTSGAFIEEHGCSEDAARVALWRLRKRKLIATPIEGFHLVLPPEYRSLGCLPATLFIDALMKHLGVSYYVGLLSAAEIHGSAHHRPQVFQVMVEEKRKPIHCGGVRLEFIVRKGLTEVPCHDVKVSSGYFKASAPEATALDLVGYVSRAGGLSNVATVVIELFDCIEEDRLVEAARLVPMAWVQRLGFLLELGEGNMKFEKLASFVKELNPRIIPLEPKTSMTKAKRNLRWRIAVNEEVEPDL